MSKASKAKKTLSTYVPKVNKSLEKIFSDEQKNLFFVGKSQKKLSYEILKHTKEHNLRPAKRLRASFIYYSYKLLGGRKEQEIIDVSASIELIHTSLLMFDDIMDQDEIRRGKPTTHEYFRKYHKKNSYTGNPIHYGESIAINAGLYALNIGYKIIGNSNFNKEIIVKALNRAFLGVERTSLGQAYDVTLESSSKYNEREVIDLHHAKTAVYTYENPLHIGAIFAQAKDNDLKLLTKYAIPGGIAFQLRDDILGVFGNSKKTGKSDHSDLKEGKVTLLIIKAFENGTKTEKRSLAQILGNPDISDSDAKEARNIIANTGSLEYSKEQTKKWAKKSQMSIPAMRKRGWDKKSIEYLDGIAQYMIERDL